MPATYEPIATTTLGSAATTITFDSIAGTYTDLRLVLVTKFSSGGALPTIRFNNNTGSNYSTTTIYGAGTSATSVRTTNYTYFELGGDNFGGSSTIDSFYTMDILSYAGSTNKTFLGTESNDLNGSGQVSRRVGLFRSTSAITRIDIIASSGNFSSGATATLYGILKA